VIWLIVIVPSGRKVEVQLSKPPEICTNGWVCHTEVVICPPRPEELQFQVWYGLLLSGLRKVAVWVEETSKSSWHPCIETARDLTKAFQLCQLVPTWVRHSCLVAALALLPDPSFCLIPLPKQGKLLMDLSGSSIQHVIAGVLYLNVHSC
jgi:hypothetical protein